MKLKRIAALLLCMLTITTAGCRKNTTVEEKAKDPMEGSITLWSSKENVELLKLSAANYNKLHSKAVINIVEIGAQGIADKLNMAVTSKETLPDIICVEDEEVKKLLKEQSALFEDTSDDLKKDNYLKCKIDNLTSEGKLYGFPLTARPAVMVFRNETLQKRAINLEYMKTWDDYTALRLSSALPFSEEKLFRVFLNQLGGSYFDKEGKPEFNSEKAVRALEGIKKLYSSGTFKNVESFEQSFDLFKKGQIDSVLIDTESLGRIFKEHPELKTSVTVVKPPAFEEGGNQAVSFGGANLMLLSESKNESLSLDFIRFASENRSNLKASMSELNTVPAYISYNDEKGFGTKLFLQLSEEIYGINYIADFTSVKAVSALVLANTIIKGQDIKSTLEELQKNLSVPK